MHNILSCAKFLKMSYNKIMCRNSKRFFCWFTYLLFSFSLFAAESGLVFYVDTTVKTSGKKGTADRPFTSLEQAVAAAHTHINQQAASVKNNTREAVSIFLRSDVFVDEALFLTVPIRLHGVNNPSITFGENAGFVVDQTALEIKECSIKRSERFTEPRTVPVLYGSYAAITLNGVSVMLKEGGDAVILRDDSRLTCTDTSFSSEQNTQAVLIRAEKSSVSAVRSTFSASGLMVLCFDFVKTDGTLTDTVCNLAAHYTGRLAELADSTVQMQKVRCSYISPLFKTMDFAVLADNVSKVELQGGCELTGFTKSIVRK